MRFIFIQSYTNSVTIDTNTKCIAFKDQNLFNYKYNIVLYK